MLRSAVCGPPGASSSRTRSGPDAVVDYTPEDVTRSDRRFDLAIDIAGTRPFRQLRRVLSPSATVVVVGGREGEPPALGAGRSAHCRVKEFFLQDPGGHASAARLLETGKPTSAVDDVFPFERVADALEDMGGGHPRGKIVITLPDA